MKFKELFFFFGGGVWGVKHCWVALQEKFQFTKPKFELNIYLNQNGKATVFVKQNYILNLKLSKLKTVAHVRCFKLC